MFGVFNTCVGTIKDRVMTFRPDPDVVDAMATVFRRHGIRPSEQIRRALRPWLEKKGVLQKAERQRAATRKRS